MMTDALNAVLQRRLGNDLTAFVPELVISGAIVLLLILRMFPQNQRRASTFIAFIFSAAALLTAFGQLHDNFDPRGTIAPIRITTGIELFSGMLVFDNFTIYLKIFLLLYLTVTIFLTSLTGVPDREDSTDFFVLLFGATLGMMLMASANHLLMVFIAVEMASLPSYALAGFLKRNRASSEASLKYVVYGGGAAGVMLYGMSLLAGKFGTAYLPDLLRFIGGSLTQGPDLIVILGMLLVFVGVAFKLSAVPFHFWCPDVFEGASAEIAAFLSVASKAGALALFVRLTYPLSSQATLLVPTLAFIATITTTFGNLAAYSQTNLKRLLAYSTIAHAGFMMMGVATMTPVGIEAVLFYLATYFLMNLGAFAVVAFLRNIVGSEDLRDMRGLVYRSPVLVVTLGVFLLSLVGLPPLAGFAAKFQIFAALFDAARTTPSFLVRQSLYTLIVVGGLNTVLSLFYYVKVLKVMVLDKPIEEVEGREPPRLAVPPAARAFAVIMAIFVVYMGIDWDQFASAARTGIGNFPAPAALAQAAPPGSAPAPHAEGKH